MSKTSQRKVSAFNQVNQDFKKFGGASKDAVNERWFFTQSGTPDSGRQCIGKGWLSDSRFNQ